MPSPNFTNNMVKGIIYKYTAPDGAVYIGQTTSIKRRLSQWMDRDGYSKGRINKHRSLYAPELWSYEVIEMITGGNKENMLVRLNKRENFWIGYYTALVDNNLCPMLLNDDIGGGNKGRELESDMIEEFARDYIRRFKRKGDNEDAEFGLVDCFDENGALIETAYLSQLRRKGKPIKEIKLSCKNHSWLGYRTYRKHGMFKIVEPCPNRPIKKEKENKEPKYCIYNVVTRSCVARANTIIEATAIMGNDSCKIASVLKGGKEQYNGFIIRLGTTPPTNDEFNAALIKFKMPR